MTETVELVSKGGSTSVHIEVCVKNNGDLRFSGQDIGQAPATMFGDSDYEYWLTVPKNQKDRFLLALIEKLYAGNCGLISELQDLMAEKGISYEFFAY